MQPESFIKPKDVIDIVIRRRWLITIPIFLVLTAGLYHAFTSPKIYEASTLLIVKPQEVPQDYVRPAVTEGAESMLYSIAQQIKSRTNMQKIINDFDLISKSGTNVYPEDTVKQLKDNIKIFVNRNRKGADVFSISYKGTEPAKVAAITNALADNFIEGSIRDREDKATGTTTFLDDELDEVRKSLLEMEAGLKDYKQSYMGQLPEQLTSNLSVLNGLQSQLAVKEESLRDLKQRLGEVENQISKSADGEGDTTNLEALEKRLADLQLRYTNNHPDIIQIKNNIADIKRGASEGGSYGQSAGSALTRRRNQLWGDIQSLERQIAALNSQVYAYQLRVEETPKREQELISLKRDYDNIDTLYNSLLKRKLESDISANMERKQKGEQFQIIDRAEKPRRPVEPNLRRVLMMALAIGFGIGCGLIYLLEYSDSSYRKPEKIEKDLNIPIIAAIPEMHSPQSIFIRRTDYALCSLFVFMTLALAGAFSYITVIGTEDALNILKTYVNI